MQNVREKNIPIAKRLVAGGANIHAVRSDGQTALTMAKETGQTALVAIFKAHIRFLAEEELKDAMAANAAATNPPPPPAAAT